MQTSESRQTNSEFLQFQGANPQLSVPPYTGQSLHAWRLQFPFEGLAPLVDLAPGHGNARLVHAGEHPGRSPTFLDYIYIISICALYIYIYFVFNLQFLFSIFVFASEFLKPSGNQCLAISCNQVAQAYVL